LPQLGGDPSGGLVGAVPQSFRVACVVRRLHAQPLEQSFRIRADGIALDHAGGIGLSRSPHKWPVPEEPIALEPAGVALAA
jgi:hypothetical protein